MDEPSTTPIKARRNRALTEAKLRKAVEDLLVEGGFGALTPSAVARRAGVDKMLIYRYFGDLPGLVRAIAFASDFFPTFEDLRGDQSVADLLAHPAGARAARVLERNAAILMERPVVLELMVWELVERNDLTAIMEEARENLGLRLITELFPDVADGARLRAMSAVLSAGVTYLALRRRKIRWYSGVDLKSDQGWREIAEAIEAMAACLDSAPAHGSPMPAANQD
jgi:AcrR family transcriptional regulator